jgi:hypothetical protein
MRGKYMTYVYKSIADAQADKDDKHGVVLNENITPETLT